MPRSARSEAHFLQQEVRAIELLASETEVPASEMEEYWAMSIDLVKLATDVEQYVAGVPRADENDLELLALRHRLRAITARLGALTLE